jgi:hypothetical protein
MNFDIDTLLGLVGKNPRGEMPVDDVGYSSTVLYLYLLGQFDESNELTVFEGSGKSGRVLVHILLPDVLTQMSCDIEQLEAWLGSLKSFEWIGDWSIIDSNDSPPFVAVEIGTYRPGEVNFDIEYLPIWDDVEHREKIDREQSDDQWDDRLSRYEDQRKETLEKTNQEINKTRSKIRRRGQHQSSNKSSRSYLDEDGNYKRNKIGLLHKYANAYYGLVGTKPRNLYKSSGEPDKGAYKLFTIVDQWGIDTAFEFISWTIRNWETVKAQKNIDGPPNPKTLAWLKDDLCPYIDAGRTPLEGVGSTSSNNDSTPEYDGDNDTQDEREEFFDELPDGIGG